MKNKEFINKDYASFYFEYFLPGDNEPANRENQDALTKTSTINQNIAAAAERPITLLLTEALFKGQTNGEIRAVIKNKIIKSFIYRCFSLLLPVIFIFLVQMSVDVPFLYARSLESADQYGDVNIYFQFDPRFKARPFRVFLKKKSEWYESLDNIDPNRVQFYEVGKLTYDFQKIEPGKYWVGFSFKFLKKNEFDGSPVLELEYVRPGATTGEYKPTENRIEVKKNEKVFVDLDIHITLTPRPSPHGKEDPQGNLEFIERSKPKSPEQERMLDGNYFPLGSGIFIDVERGSLKNAAHSKISFEFIVFDDYPLAHWQQKED